MCIRIYRGNSITHQRGFTLIEIVSAMVVMSLVMVLATMSLAQFSRYSEQTGIGFEQRISRYLALERLAQTVEQMLDYYVFDTTQSPQLYFVGDSREMRFVTTHPWSDDANSAISYLVVEEEQQGTNALVLYQRNLTERVFFKWTDAPEATDMQAVVVIAGARDIQFEYLGVENLRQLYPGGSNDNYRKNLRWQSRFLGRENGYLPEQVKITVQWPDDSSWPLAIAVRAFNLSKRSFMLDGVTQ